MNAKLEIEAEWEALERGAPEERATFAAIGVRFGNVWLTEAEDAFVKRIRQKVLLSGYRLAEWLAWNWWRLRWEPRRRSNDWAMAHRMSTIGGGYVWPNITIVSDGARIVLDSHGTLARPEEPLRYIARHAAVVPAGEFEDAVDRFLEQVIGKLIAEGVLNTNLDAIWNDLQEERRTPAIAIRRKFEALLGADPDSVDDTIIDRLIADSADLGQQGMEELAAVRSNEENPVTSDDVIQLAISAGFDSNPSDAAKLRDDAYRSLPEDGAAWRREASPQRENCDARRRLARASFPMSSYVS